MRPLPALILTLALCAVAAPARAEDRKDVEFAKPGGFSLTLDAHIPDGPGPFPTAILVHGGGFTNGTKQSYITPIFEPLSQAGFTWFTINYRLAPDHRYPACLEDVETAIRWVKDHAAEYKVDVNRIALIGESAGGYLVAAAGSRGKGKTKVAAVVPYYAPFDLNYQVDEKGLSKSLTSLFGFSELNEAARKKLRETSPASHVRRDLPPHLMIHGTADEQVPYGQSVRYLQQLRAAGVPADMFTIPNGRHGMGGWDRDHPEYKTVMIDWLKKTLK